MIKEEKNKHISIFLLCVALCFMMLFYAPMEIYLTNSNEFWFGIKNILPVVSVSFCCVSIILMLGMEFLNKILPEKAMKFIITVMIVVCSELYIQGNYVPRKYGLLDGKEIEWSSYKGYAVASIALVIIAVLWGGFVYIFLNQKVYLVAKWTGTVIIAVLLVALVSIIPGADLKLDDSQIVVSDKNEFSFATDKNIIMVCFDAFDADFFRPLYNSDQEKYAGMLEDFIFYSNTVGAYPVTDCAVVALLTGEYYMNGEPFDDFVKKAYDVSPAFNALINNNYTINIYANSKFIDTSAEYISNIVTADYKINDSWGFAKKIYKIVLFNYMPHQVKKFFLVYTDDFDKFKTISDDEGNCPSNGYDPVFYKKLCENGITVDSDMHNSFKYVHLQGTHPPYSFGAELIEDGKEHNPFDAANGCLNELSELILQLKQENIYDDTAIIVLADHGCGGTGEMNSNPLLLFKDFDAHHAFETSENYVSWEDISYTVAALATGEDHSDAIWNQTDDTRIRKFIDYDNTAKSQIEGHMSIMTEYNVIGNVMDETRRYEPTGRTFE